jgi:Fe-S cluster biogenesis protein NfuA
MTPSEVAAMMETIEKALEPIRNSLEADGFDLKVDSFEEGVVSLRVQAGPEACIECLVPQEHIKLRIEHRLKGLARVVRLRYPDQLESSH